MVENETILDEQLAVVEEKPVKKTGKPAPRRAKKKEVTKQVTLGRAYVQASYNNTLVTITDMRGDTLAWSSAGHLGFRGPKKATPYAASAVVRELAQKVNPLGVRDLHVLVHGVGSGREAAIRGLNAQGFNILSIKDVTPIPHNGCRAPRPRRV